MFSSPIDHNGYVCVLAIGKLVVRRNCKRFSSDRSVNASARANRDQNGFGDQNSKGRGDQKSLGSQAPMARGGSGCSPSPPAESELGRPRLLRGGQADGII